jgi:hypothetical protein
MTGMWPRPRARRKRSTDRTAAERNSEMPSGRPQQTDCCHSGLRSERQLLPKPDAGFQHTAIVSDNQVLTFGVDRRESRLFACSASERKLPTRSAHCLPRVRPRPQRMVAAQPKRAGDLRVRGSADDVTPSASARLARRSRRLEPLRSRVLARLEPQRSAMATHGVGHGAPPLSIYSHDLRSTTPVRL